jgi:hypothetical protein
MAQKYFFIEISFYPNIVCQNVSSEKGLAIEVGLKIELNKTLD